MKRRTFIQTVAAVFGAAAIHSPAEPKLFMAIDPASPNGKDETVIAVQYLDLCQIDKDFARLANESIQRRTYAVMKGLA